MATIADNLQKIIEIKKDIKDAINNKGVMVSDSDKFDTYASKIMEISTGGGGGDCDPNEYAHYEFKKTGSGCQGDNLTSVYQPFVTIEDKEYQLQDYPNREVIDEEDNYDCKCHQLLVQSYSGISGVYIAKTNLNSSISGNYGVPLLITNSEEVTSLDGFLSNNSVIGRIERLPKFPKVTNMSRMFYNNQNLSHINIGDSFEGAKPTTMAYAFYYNVLEDPTVLKGIDTSENTDFSYMFSFGGKAGTEFNNNIIKWDTSKATNFSNMFNYANFDKIDLTGFNWNIVTNFSNMFNGFKGKDIVVDGITFTLSGNTAYNQIGGLSSLTNLTNLTATNCKFFDYLTSLSTYVPFGNTIASNAKGTVDFSGLDLSPVKNSTTFNIQISGWKATEIIMKNITMPLSQSNYSNTQIITGCANVKNMDLSGWKNTTNFKFGTYGAFFSNTNLETLDLSGWDLTGTGFETAGHFQYDTKLKTIYMCGCNSTTIQAVRTSLSLSNLSQSVEIIECDDNGDDYFIDGAGFTVNTQISDKPEGLEGSIYESTNFEQSTDKIQNATFKIRFVNQPNFSIWIKNLAKGADPETGLLSIMVSKLDTDFFDGGFYTAHAPIANKAKAIQSSSGHTQTWESVTFPNDGGEHYFYVTYTIIDNAQPVNGQAKGYVFIPKKDGFGGWL